MAGLLAATLLAGCVSTRVPPMGYQGQPFRPEPDERALWAQAAEEEEKLARTGKLHGDPVLEAYLEGIAARLIPPEAQAAGAPPPRVRVFRDPTLNAFALPNGHVYIHTGLLARLENEAQLAAILGHELAHVTNRHALRFNRDARNKQIWLTLGAVAASIGVAAVAGQQAREGHQVRADVLRATSGVFLGLGLQLALLAAVNGYGRDLEREADAEGLERMVRAGYDPREAARVFELLQQDRPDRGALETFFFGRHPQLEERLASTRELLRTRYAGLDTERLASHTGEFQRRTRVLVRDNAALDAQAGRYQLALAQLDRVLAVTPDDPVAHLHLGDLWRLQAQRAQGQEQAELLERARAAYERAASLDPAYPEPFRQLGLLYYQSRQPDRAGEAFRRYLALRPDGPDAQRIREYLAELERR